MLLYIFCSVDDVIAICCSNSEDMESNLMVDDVYDIITAMSATADGRIAVRSEHTVSALCQAVASRCYRMFMFLVHVLVHAV